MRAVMREFLFLLAAGQVERHFFGSGSAVAAELSYEDLQYLRPSFAASSWRVTAGRLQQMRYIAKTYEGGVRFQITKLGEQALYEDFPHIVQGEKSETWLLCALIPQIGAVAQYAAARRLLYRQGYVSLLPGLYARFQVEYSGVVTRELQLLGFIPSFFPVNVQSARPASLESILYEQAQKSAKKNRKVERFSEDIAQLLSELEKKNMLHAKDKQRIGSFVVSGLTVLQEIEPLQYLSGSPVSSLERVAQSVDGLMRIYAKHSRVKN